MKMQVSAYAVIVMVAFAVVVIPAHSDQPSTVVEGAVRGWLELECNLSGVVLYLCPQENFSRRTVRRFLGLIKTQEEACSEGQFYLGTTPLTPVSLPTGRFVLIVPPQYSRENDKAFEILIEPEKKTFFMLKLLRVDNRQQNSWPHAGDSEGGSSGSGSAGAVGTGPPK
jgi:hypothetical protein